MVGKTVEKICFGIREDSEDLHQSEVLYVQFTDGDVLAIDTGSNIGEIASKTAMRPNEFLVDFVLTWVEAPSNK